MPTGNEPLQGLDTQAWQDCDRIVARFEEAWKQGERPPIADFLPAAAGRQAILIELVHTELEYRCAAGEPARVEEYLEKYPTLLADRSVVLALIAAEYELRRDQVDATPARYLARFPNYAEELRPKLDIAAGEAETLSRDTASDRKRGPLEWPVIPEYEIVAELGRGGMGVVYQAIQRGLNRTVALKMIVSGSHAGEQERARFRGEAEAVARLHHPNIVQIYEIGEQNGRPYFSLEYVAGGSLDKQLAGAPQPAPVAAEVVETMARAMHFAHQQGIVHRDLKPANVLLASGGCEPSVEAAETGGSRPPLAVFEPKITDFGLAKQLGGDSGQTHSGTILGTPSYMAPEQAAGQSKEIGPLADVYALGAILYEMLTGRPPFRSATVLDTLEQVRTQEPVPPSRLEPRVPRDIETICLKCLNKEPHQRYASAEALAEDLRRFRAGEPICARPAPAWERGLKWGRRRPALAALVGVSCLAALILVGLIVGLYYGTQLQGALKSEKEQRTEAEHQRAEAIKQRREAERLRAEAEAERQIRLEMSNTSLQQQGIETATRHLSQRRFSLADIQHALGLVPGGRRGWEWHRLMRESVLVPQPDQVVGQHDWGVFAARLSKDGRWLVTSGQDGRVVLRATDTLRETELHGGQWMPKALRWQPAFQVSRQGPAPGLDCFLGLAWVEDGVRLAGASLRGHGVVWNLRSGHPIEVLQHDRPLNVVTASADGKHLLFGDDRGTLLHHDLATGQTSKLLLEGGAVLATGFVAQHSWIVGQEDGSLRLVDLAATRVLREEKVRGPVWGLDVTADGRSLVVACAEASVPTFVINPDQATLTRGVNYLRGEQGPGFEAFHAVRLSPDGQQIWAGTNHGHLLGWQRYEAMPQFVFPDARAVMLPPGVVSQLPLPQRRRIGALEIAPDNTTVFTGGLEGAVLRWPLVKRSGITTISVGEKPTARFAPGLVAPTLLWVGAADGTLSLWDSRQGVKRHSVQAHRGPITGLDLSADGQRVVTGGDDGTLAFWTRVGEEIRPLAKPIAVGRPVRSVSLRPDGRRVALYDEDDQVQLWDVAGRRRLQQRSMRQHPDDRAERGLVAFNADGSTLAAAGPGASFWLLKGDALEDLPRPADIVAGRGGTAIAWNPRDHSQVVGGDTLGRAYIHPFLLDNPQRRMTISPNALPVAGMAFTPDGSRLAVAHTDGVIEVIDPRWTGHVLTLRSSHGDATGLTFDARGERLAMSHSDGRLEIWETQPEATELPERPSAGWAERVLRRDDEARDVELPRSPALCLDRHGRLGLLYSRLVPDPNSPDKPARRLLLLGREESGSFRDQEIAILSALEVRALGGVARSLALTTQGDEWFGVLRWPSDKVPYGGQLFLFGPPGSGQSGYFEKLGASRGPVQPLTEVANSGFYTHLFPGKAGKPSMSHFDHSGHYFLVTHWVNGQWETVSTGRQGDGMYPAVAAGADGSLHAVFVPRRFNGDPGPLVYLRSSGSGPEDQLREVLDPAYDASAVSVAVAADGAPLVVYTRHGADGGNELLLARRTAAGWERSVVFKDWRPSLGSYPVIDPQGTLRFAYLDPTNHRRLMLATYAGGSWGTQEVARLPLPAIDRDDNPIRVTLAVLYDARARPVVVVSQRADKGGWLRVFRPTDEGVNKK